MISNAAIIDNIRYYQRVPCFHELMCGNNSQNHHPLIPIERNDEVILLCRDCDYEQEVPEIFREDSYITNNKNVINEIVVEFNWLKDIYCTEMSAEENRIRGILY
jgi:hypothetical protein